MMEHPHGTTWNRERWGNKGKLVVDDPQVTRHDLFEVKIPVPYLREVHTDPETGGRLNYRTTDPSPSHVHKYWLKMKDKNPFESALAILMIAQTWPKMLVGATGSTTVPVACTRGGAAARSASTPVN